MAEVTNDDLKEKYENASPAVKAYYDEVEKNWDKRIEAVKAKHSKELQDIEHGKSYGLFTILDNGLTNGIDM